MNIITFETGYDQRLIDEKNGIRLYELIPYNGEPEKDRFYVARWNDVCQRLESVIPTDLGAIRYIAHRRTRDNARKWFRKLSNHYERQ